MGSEYEEIQKFRSDYLRQYGASVIGKAVTDTLLVSPNGSGIDGKTWPTAIQTIEDALDMASTDGDDCTLILISPHTTNYDIYRTGDPTWSANVILGERIGIGQK